MSCTGFTLLILALASSRVRALSLIQGVHSADSRSHERLGRPHRTLPGTGVMCVCARGRASACVRATSESEDGGGLRERHRQTQTVRHADTHIRARLQRVALGGDPQGRDQRQSRQVLCAPKICTEIARGKWDTEELVLWYLRSNVSPDSLVSLLLQICCWVLLLCL